MLLGKLTIISIMALTGSTVDGAIINMTWDYDFTNVVICTNSVTTNCLDHFEAGTIDQVSGKFVSSTTSPITPLFTGVVKNIMVNFNITPLFGQTTFSIIAVGKDFSGTRVTSDPTKSTAVFNFGPQPPSNMKIVVSFSLIP